MRLLQPDPAARGHYLIGVRPDTLGATLRAVGTPDFVGAVTEFVNDSIDADAVHPNAGARIRAARRASSSNGSAAAACASRPTRCA